MIRNKLLERFSLIDEQEKSETVYETIRLAVPFKGTNLWILIFAIFIASIGLNVNSTAVIIGAMLISPLMGPIMGLGLGVAINDVDLLKKSFNSYFFATCVGLLTSALYFTITPLDKAHSELLARTSPNVYDVLIALFGGLAGIVATSSKLKGNVIPGVAIATALMPPLCTAGYGLATLQFNFLLGALYLFFINTVFIGLATIIVIRLYKYPLRQWQDEKKAKRSNRIIMAIVILTTIPSIYFAYDVVVKTRYTEKVNDFINNEAQLPNNYLLRRETDPKHKKLVLIYGGELISPSTINSLKKKLIKYHLQDTELTVKQGFAYLNNNSNDNTEIKNALDKQISELQQYKLAVDSIRYNEQLSLKVFKELKVQYPQIQSVILQPAVSIQDSSTNHLWISVIKHSATMSDIEKSRLQKWIATRIEHNDIKFIYEK